MITTTNLALLAADEHRKIFSEMAAAHTQSNVGEANTGFE